MDLSSIGSPALWAGFLAFVAAMLALDLGVFHKKAHDVSVKEAAAWSAVWIGLALAFCAGLWLLADRHTALQFLAGYVLEKSLSVDNIFVIAILFSSFAVPLAYQHRVLFWGIVGALVLRAALIFAGAALVQRFSWTLYVFGAVLVVTALKLFWQKDEHFDPEKSRVLKAFRRLVPMTPDYRGQSLTVVEGGRRLATPLLAVLVMIEATDVVFAVDSIPAVFAVTTDPFIVFTSNIFAILGLRSLYFLLAGAMGKFHYLKVGLSAVLAFVGGKMLLADVFHVPIGISLGVIAALLVAAVAASLVRDARRKPQHLPT